MSEHERAAKILAPTPLGDRKPSALMDEMLALMGSHTACFLFRYAFLEKLPERIRVQLANEPFDNPREFARRADALWVAGDSSMYGHMAATVQASAGTGRRVRYRQASPNSKSRATSPGDECYYHKRFGSKAYQCRPPCAYPKNATASRQ